MNVSTEFSFGEWLKRKRKALDLTREELAKRVGYSAATIRKIEDEERHPSTQVVERLADIFKIPQNERESFLRFARRDGKFAPVEIDENLPWRASTRLPRSNIPATSTSLIGREKEIADVREYLAQDDIRLVTLLGPPGIGKTRLNIEVARASLHDFPDGVFFVALAPLDNSPLIAVTVAQALGYVGAQNISIDEQLKEGIGEKQMLLVLDNCEHLIEDVSSLASELLSVCPHLKLLTTSRESLRILGEWLYPVPAFAVPAEDSSIDVETASSFPALALFAERARAVRPDFSLDPQNIKTLSAICTRLDGLPLAIELMAARIRLMPPEALLARMNNPFILSANGMRAASTRQKTLQNAIRWSYDLLSAEEQRLFAYLSIFSGGFTLDAAEAMFALFFTNKPVAELITSLLDKSLLQYDTSEHGEARYAMLATIQEYARTCLRQMGEELEIHNRHLAYFLNLAENADKELRGPNQLEWLQRLRGTVDNLRAAFDWAIATNQTEPALRLALRLHWFWFMRGDHTEGRQWLHRVLDMPDTPLHPAAHAEALTQLAYHTMLQIGPNEAHPFVEQALSISRANADKHNTAGALMQLGMVLQLNDDFAGSRTHLEESKTLFQEVGDEWGYAQAVSLIALGLYRQNDNESALALHEHALTMFSKIGDRLLEAVMRRAIGILKGRLGDVKGGAETLRQGLKLLCQLNNTYFVRYILWGLAEVASIDGNHSRAVMLYWAGRNVSRSIGAWRQLEEPIFERALAQCRAALSEEAFAEAAEKGRLMTMEQAIAYALGDHDS